MNTGDLLLFRGSEIISASICALSHAEVSHAGIILRTQGYAPIVWFYESNYDGFRPHLMESRVRKYNGDIWLHRLTGQWANDEYRREVETNILRLHGTPYDGLLLPRMAWERPEIDVDKLICSEAVQAASGIITGAVMAPGELLSIGRWEREGERIK